MKISRVDVFQLDIPLEKPKRYPNKTYESLDDTIVRLETDSGSRFRLRVPTMMRPTST